MNRSSLKKFNPKKKFVNNRANRLLFFVFTLSASFAAIAFQDFQTTSAQIPVKVQSATTPFRIGERLTYSISFEKFYNAGYAEVYAVSRGKLGDKDAVELRAKIKTNDLVSAAFYFLDESRTTFAASDSGLPLYTKKISNTGIEPKETINNYLVNSTIYNDLLTLIYQARNAGGSGNFNFQEDEKIYNVVFSNTGAGAKLKTGAGEFETNVSTVQSDYLTEKGITNLQINFSADDARVPVLIRLKTAKGDFRAEIASIQIVEPEAVTQPISTPIQPPRPMPTSTPKATPTPYLDNQPLAKELPFALGETLDYQISTNGQMLGIVTLQAKERKQIGGSDSLVLTATVTETQPNQQLFRLNDEIRAQVDPLSLAPKQIIYKLTGTLAPFSQQIIFDQQNGTATGGKGAQAEIPVGTHSLLSLAYAVRSFNLKPSRDALNPVNDTRVAVFFDDKAYVLTLRPSDTDVITLKGEKIPAQLISVSTGNPAFDQYNMRVWLGTDDKRLPLRLMFGAYQADLVTEKQIPPK